MTAVRQDAWSSEDDLILAEVTLRHIREGSTQLAAFEEVGEKSEGRRQPADSDGTAVSVKSMRKQSAWPRRSARNGATIRSSRQIRGSRWPV